MLDSTNRGLCGFKINNLVLGCSGPGFHNTEVFEVQGALVGMKWYTDQNIKFWQPVMVSIEDHISAINH